MLTTTVYLRQPRNLCSELTRSVAAVAAFGAKDRFVSAFQLGGIRYRRQFSRRFVAALHRRYMRWVDPRCLKALQGEPVQLDAGA
jgi:hypothetical protein